MEPTSVPSDLAHSAKRRKLNEDGETRTPITGSTGYDNSHVEGNARVQFGHSYNTTYYNTPACQHPGTGASTPLEISDKTAETHASVIEALGFDEMYDRYDTIDPVYSGTCQWFFDGAEYNGWHDPDKMHDHHGFLWIVGKPGAGKSTLMKDALLRGRNTFGQERDHTTVSFFFDARAGESGQLLQKSLQGLFRSLLYQLLKAQPQVAAGLEGRRLTRAQEQGWPLQSLQALFRDAVLSLGTQKLTCYIDALDECEESEARRMVSIFEDLAASSVKKSGQFYVFLSSRHYPRIAISRCQQLTLERQEGHAQDIARYIKSKLRIGSSQEARKFRAAVLKKASGVFLWVVLVVPILDTGSSCGKRLEELYRNLEETPSDLHELFANILKRGAHDESVLLLTLQWLMFSQRPLTREELYCAVWYDSPPEDIQPWDPEVITIEVMNKYLLHSSKGLTELTRHKPPKVRFIHESVRDYLRSSGLRSLDPHMDEDVVARCHERLKRCCAHYVEGSAHQLLQSPKTGTSGSLSKRGTDVKALRIRTSKSYPFLIYALEGMIYHANASHAAGDPQDGYVLSFPCQQWTRLRNFLFVHANDRLTETVTKDYIFALNGALHLADIWIRANGISTDCHEKHKSTLGAAIVSGNSDLVQLLLDHGACPNVRIPGRQSEVSCLDYALSHEHPLIAKSLINAGANVNVDHLYRAVWTAQQSVVETLLIRGVNLAARDTLGRSVLHHTVRGGSRPIVSCLLNHGADINSPDNDGDTTLHYAAQEGHELLVFLLLEEGADFSILNRWGTSAMHRAASRGHNAIVSLFLDRGANIDSPNNDGDTALHVAAQEGHQLLISLLLERGGDISISNKFGSTALHQAASWNRLVATRTLLESGADPYAPDESGDTPLHLSARFGDIELLEVLLSHIPPNDNAERQRILDESAEVAHSFGFHRNVQLLVEHGATPP